MSSLSMRALALIGSVCGLGLLGTACVPYNPVAPTVTFTQADNGTAHNVQVGATVIVSLPGNTGTGYQWVVSSIAGSSVRAIGSPTVVPTNPNLPGSSAVWQFTFQVVAQGGSTIVINNIPPGGGAPAESFNITIVGS